MNLWSSDPSTTKFFVKYVPWYTTISLNEEVLEITLPLESVNWDVTEVIDSGIEKTYEVSLAVPTQTKPGCRVRVGVFPLVVTSNEMVACAAVLDLGT